MNAALGIAAVAFSLCQTACDPPVRRSEVESIAEDFADARATQLESRIEDLEQKLKAIDDRSAVPSSSYVTAIHAALDEERENRERADKGLIDHYNNHLKVLHGGTAPAGSH